jgi:hypothetical protein
VGRRHARGVQFRRLTSRDRWVALSTGRSARSPAVSLEFTESTLDLTTADGEVWRWPYRSIRRRPLEGAAAETVFGCLDMPDARLVLRDPSLVAGIADRCPNLDALLKPNRRTLAVIGGWIGGAILLVVVGYFVLPRLAASFARIVPASWEARLGDNAERNLAAILDVKRFPRGDGYAAIDALVSRLSIAAALEHEPRVVILRHKMLNAFALPGNRIVITSGMILYLETSDELAGSWRTKSGICSIAIPSLY